MTERVLVTGGTGFIGASLVRRLVARGDEVHVLSRSKYVSWKLEAVRREISLVVGDVTHRHDIEKVLRRTKPTGVIHLAGIYSDRGPAPDPGRVILSNVQGTMNVMDAACQSTADWFINAGSYSEYRLSSAPFLETSPVQPRTLYGFSKLCGSQYCQMAGDAGKISVVNLRIATPYGPMDSSVKLVPTLISAILRRRRVTLANRQSIRDYIFVDDLSDAFLVAIESCANRKGCQTFNVGTGRGHSVVEIIDLISELSHRRIKVDWDRSLANANDGSVMRNDASKLSTELGWRPRTKIRTGLRLTYEWFKAHPDHSTEPPTNSGHCENLSPS